MNYNIVKKSTSPYIKESLTMFCIDTLIVLLIVTIFFSAAEDIPGQIQALFVSGIIGIGYYFLEFVLIYRLGILAWLDRKKTDYTSSVITIETVKVELSWSGRSFNSIISKFYSKDLEVKPYEINCIDKSGKKQKFRMVLSRKQRNDIYDLFQGDNKLNKVIVIYCIRSRIILKFEICDDNGLKISSENKRKILEKIRRINVTV